MSNLDPAPDAVDLAPGVHRAVDVLEARKAAIGDGTEVRRLLPQRSLRTIGAWCFLDHYGPDDVSAGPGMQVPPHPHIGLQTASWLFDGLVLHRDSLGSEQLIRPGELNLMTSGRGIAHSEESPSGKPALLHGVQLWIALPLDMQFTEPEFAHHAALPVLELPVSGGADGIGGAGGPGARVTVVAGEFGGERSPAVVHTPLIGLEVSLPADGNVMLATRADFEYGVMAADGPACVGAEGLDGAGEPAANDSVARIEPGMFAYVPAGNGAIQLSASGPNRFFVVGGVPLDERLIMWWNFVGRSAAEIASARESWMAGDGRFGEVRGYHGAPLQAPALPPGTLKPRLPIGYDRLRGAASGAVLAIADNLGCDAVPSGSRNETLFTSVLRVSGREEVVVHLTGSLKGTHEADHWHYDVSRSCRLEGLAGGGGTPPVDVRVGDPGQRRYPGAAAPGRARVGRR